VYAKEVLLLSLQQYHQRTLGDTMDKNWADKHTGSKPLFQDRTLAEPKAKLGPVIALLVVGLIAAGGVVAWKAGLLTQPEPVATPEPEPIAIAAPEPVKPQPPRPVVKRAPVIPDAPVEDVPDAPEQAPAAPVMSDQQRAAIQRGIDTLERQKAEHATLAASYQAQMDEASRKKYPPGKSTQTFEQYTADLIRAARAKKDTGTANNLEIQVGAYRAKMAELATKRAHELEVIESLEKRQAVERAKLP
jgi:hypothetical protein